MTAQRLKDWLKGATSFKVWRIGDEYGFSIGWFWIAAIALWVML
jgi:hypothetical protein